MKKERESIHLQNFKEVCPFFPDGEIESSEQPDFAVHTQHMLLGIEHTGIFQPGIPNGGSLQARDAWAQRVVKKASDLYLRNHNRPLLVQIAFKATGKMRRGDVNCIAEKITRLIVGTPVEPGAPITLKRTNGNSECFPEEVAMVHLYCHPNGKENGWRCSSSGYIPQITPEQLQEKIDQKEPKPDKYTSRCSNVWLLIVADDCRIPSTVDLSALAFTHHYVTRFERVFFFWNSSRRYIELPLASASQKT